MSKKKGSANPERAGTRFERGALNLAYLCPHCENQSAVANWTVIKRGHSYLHWVGKVLPRVRIDTDFMKHVRELVDDGLQLDQVLEKPFSIAEHDVFLRSSNKLDSWDGASMGFCHAEQKHCLPSVVEDLVHIPISDF
jgi:hypothetical protein